MSNYKEKVNKKIKDSKKYIENNDMKNVSKNKLQSFLKGLKMVIDYQ